MPIFVSYHHFHYRHLPDNIMWKFTFYMIYIHLHLSYAKNMALDHAENLWKFLQEGVVYLIFILSKYCHLFNVFINQYAKNVLQCSTMYNVSFLHSYCASNKSNCNIMMYALDLYRIRQIEFSNWIKVIYYFLYIFFITSGAKRT